MVRVGKCPLTPHPSPLNKILGVVKGRRNGEGKMRDQMGEEVKGNGE